MASIEKYTRTYTDTLQKHVPEPIEAVAMLLETGEVVQLENQRLVGLDGFNAAFYGRLAQTAA